MSIQTVQNLCTVSDMVKNDVLADQIANLEDINNGKIDPDAFFRRNHFTHGLDTLIRHGFDRLSGRSETGAFYLSQSMGGGKTHSLIAFALLAQDDGLRHRIIPDIAPSATFGAAKVIIFNGHQSPANFLWGEIAERLGRPETMSRFWRDGAKTPGTNDWIAAIGDSPVLILLDELPSYLSAVEGDVVGNSTVADVTILALERLFNALIQLPRACVVVTNLVGSDFAEGSAKLKNLLTTLNKQAQKYAEAITPVQQNTGEIYQIIRRKLFDRLPGEDAIIDIAQAYVDELNRAKKVGDIAVVPESYVDSVRESYPFHPSIRDVVARFKENPGYQQTRALIRLLRLAVASAMASTDQIFLIGLQHLDLSDPKVAEEIRKINPHFGNAISKDIADKGNAIAEKIDAELGSNEATEVAKLLLMASLSAAEQPMLGLRRNQIVEYLIDPLTKTPAITGAIDRLIREAEYLFPGADQRLYIGKTANVTSEINNIAASLADEIVDQELRLKLLEIFDPKTKALYQKVLVLPALDEIKITEDEVTLLVIERSPKELPKELVDWWKDLDRQNRVLIVTADMTALGTLKTIARHMRAVGIVDKAVLSAHGKDSSQAQEVEKIRTRDANQFTSAARETFSALVFPSTTGLRDYSQFKMEFTNNDYRGEQQIIKTLEERGKFYSTAKIEREMVALRAQAEDELFDADAVQRSELRRKAAAKSGWYWLAPHGLDHIIDTSVRTKHWRDRGGLIEKKFTRQTAVAVRLDGPIEQMVTEGVYRLIVTAEEADLVHASETGAPDPAVAGLVTGRTYQTSAAKVWFVGVDSKREAQTGPALCWEAPIKLRPQVRSGSKGFEVEWDVLPRSAEVRISFDGNSPRTAPIACSPQVAPPDATKAILVACIAGRFGEEIKEDLIPDGTPVELVRSVRNDKPLLLRDQLTFGSITKLTDGIAALRAATGATISGGSIEIGTHQSEHYIEINMGDAIKLGADAIEALMKSAGDLAGFEPTQAKGRFNGISFATGKDFKVFADALKLDFENLKWFQEE